MATPYFVELQRILLFTVKLQCILSFQTPKSPHPMLQHSVTVHTVYKSHPLNSHITFLSFRLTKTDRQTEYGIRSGESGSG
jgi:hypothetical protein